jgi:hypothetical protein
MRGSLRSKRWVHLLLSLIVLSANVGAPFRSAARGRALLAGLRLNGLSCPVVRLRSTSPVGVNQGFRAVVGLDKGGPGKPDRGSPPRASLTLLPSPGDTPACRHSAPRAPRSNPHLRC